MSVTSRARSISRFGMKVQRRIVIAQALWWPTLILTAGGITAAAALVVKRRRAGLQTQPDPAPTRSPVPV